MQPVPIQNALAAALVAHVPPNPQDPKVDWLDVANHIVLALSGSVAFVAKEDYDKDVTELFHARRRLAELDR